MKQINSFFHFARNWKKFHKLISLISRKSSCNFTSLKLNLPLIINLLVSQIQSKAPTKTKKFLYYFWSVFPIFETKLLFEKLVPFYFANTPSKIVRLFWLSIFKFWIQFQNYFSFSCQSSKFVKTLPILPLNIQKVFSYQEIWILD